MSFCKSSDANTTIPPTEMIGEEMQKYVSITRIFLCKVIECIYCNRCPKELSDFTFDEDRWFSLDIPKSLSLRELVSRRTIYGWFQIDVSITDLETVVERWVLAHEQCECTESRPLFTGKKRELRYHTFRKYSQIMRSIYSILDALPVKTLDLCLGQISGTNRRITAVCSHFRSLPVQKENLATDENILELDFGPIITPIGKCTIQCSTLKKVEDFIPKIYEAPTSHFSDNQKNPLKKSGNLVFSQQESSGSSSSGKYNNDNSIFAFVDANENENENENNNQNENNNGNENENINLSDNDNGNKNGNGNISDSIWLMDQLESQQQQFGSTFSDEFIKRSFTPDPADSTAEEDDENGHRNGTRQTPEEFLEYLSSLSVDFSNDFDLAQVRKTFEELSEEVQQMIEDLNLQ